MIIRKFDMDKDYSSIADISNDIRSRTDDFGILPVAEDKLIETIGRLSPVPGVEIIVAEHEGRIIGCIGMIYTPHLWNNDLLLAEELFLWVSEKAPVTTLLRLIRYVMRKIKQFHAIATFRVLCIDASQQNKMRSLFKHLGLKEAETSFVGNF